MGEENLPLFKRSKRPSLNRILSDLTGVQLFTHAMCKCQREIIQMITYLPMHMESFMSHLSATSPQLMFLGTSQQRRSPVTLSPLKDVPKWWAKLFIVIPRYTLGIIC